MQYMRYGAEIVKSRGILHFSRIVLELQHRQPMFAHLL